MEDIALIKKIEQVPALKNALHQMIDDNNGILNLVRPDWKAVLYNDVTFQDYQCGKRKFGLPYVKNESWSTEYIPGNGFDVLVPGKFTFATHPKEPEKTNILCENSTILNELTKGFTQTVTTPHILSDASYRFFGQECNPIVCPTCRKAFEMYGKYLKSTHQWCISRTKIFDGERIRHCFREQVAHTSGCAFYGFFALRIRSRYSFENEDKKRVFKIGGDIRDIVLFKENNLSVVANDFKLDIISLNMYSSYENDYAAAAATNPELVETSCRDSTSVAEELLVELFNQPKRTSEGEETGAAKKQKVEDLVDIVSEKLDSIPIEAIPTHLQDSARDVGDEANKWKCESSHEKII